MKAHQWFICARTGLWGFGVLLFLFSCSSSSEPHSQTSQEAKDELRLDLPEWCSIKESEDEVCFRCEREDGGTRIPYEQCLKPGPSFSSGTKCLFSAGLTKQITCDGTKSGELFKMDASLAKERLAAALPAFLQGLDIIVRQTYSDDSHAAKLTADLRSFWSSRITLIIRGENLNETAEELTHLANRHLKTPMTEDQARFFKETTVTVLNRLIQDLNGRKDYSLSRVVQRGLALARSIPISALGDSANYLSGSSLASLLSKDPSRTLQGVFKSLNFSMLGMTSIDDFLAELSNAE